MAGVLLDRRRRRAGMLLGVICASVVLTLLNPFRAFAAGNDEDLQHARQQLAGLVDLVERLDEAPALADALPLSDLDPSTVLSGIVDDASGAVDSLRTQLAAAPGTDHGDPGELANWLDGLDSGGPVDILVGGPGADDGDDAADDGEPVVTKNATTGVVDIELSITVSKDVPVPIELATGLMDIAAAGSEGTFPVTFSLETSDLHLRFDPATFASPTTASQSLALLTETTPTVTLRARTADTGSPLSERSANLGFTAVTITGEVGFDLGYQLSLVDPDDADGLGGTQEGDGKITVDEMTSIAVADLVTGEVVDGDEPAVSASVGIESDLYDGDGVDTDGDGNPVGDPDVVVTYLDSSLTDATAGAVSLTPSASPLGDFRNFSATDALGAISRLVTMLDGLQNTGALDLSLPFVNGWDDPGNDTDSPQGTFSDAIGISGALADALTDPDTDGDGVPNADAAEDDDLARTIDVPGGESEIGRPTFENAQQMVKRLDKVLEDVLGEDVDVDLVYDPAEKRLELAFPLRGEATRSVELAFGDLDILSSVDVTGAGLVDLVGSYELDMGIALDLSAQPREDGGEIGSCTDGLDNGAPDADIDPDTTEDDGPNADDPETPVDEGAIPLTDAGDPDCAGAQTLEQRVLFDVGDEDDTDPELEAGIGVSATGVGASARIGLLEAGIEGGSFSVAGPAGADQAALAVDLTDKTGDGWLTIEQVLSQLGKAVAGEPTDDLDFVADLAAEVRGTLPVSSNLGGVDIAGGDIVIEGDYAGPVTGALALVENISVDASDLHASDLFDFSPCSNTEDDDGDGSVNDGCDAVDVPETDCADASDNDSDGVVNDGCAPNDDPESNSGALFDQLIAALEQVAGVLEDTGVLPADTLDAPLPIIGSSFNDLVSFVDSLEGLADQTKDPGELSLGAAACTGSADDDGDGFVNDGCPTLPAGGLPEAGPGCANATSDDSASGEFPDPDVNDGCPAVSPTLQKLSDQLAKLLGDALDQVGDPDATTVAAPILYDPTTKQLEIDFDIHFERTLATPLALDLPEPLGSIVSLDDLSSVQLLVAANLDLGFGVDLDDLGVFVATDSHLDVSATASGEDMVFEAGVGSLQLQVGQQTPVPEAGVQCDDQVDSDGDGYANDGCPPQKNPEYGDAQCSDDNAGGDGKDDDGDGVADDGCGGDDPLTAGDPQGESGAQCVDDRDGQDDDSDGIADDGCGDAGEGDSPPAAANPETGDQCTGDEDGKDNDGDTIADDGCEQSDPATAGPFHPEGSASPSDTATGTGPDCAITDADPEDDDNDGAVNDGCEAKADRARFFLGAKIDVDVDNSGDTVAIDDVDLEADFSGTPQSGCDGVVIPADTHTVGTAPGADAELEACAVLPLYLDVGGNETPVRDPIAPSDPASEEYAHWATAHHVLFAIDELTDPTDVALHFDTTALDDFIQGQVMDLLLMETGIERLLDLLEQVLEADLLSFALPLIGGEGANAAGIVDDLRETIKAAVDETISGNTWDPTFTAAQARDALLTPLFDSLNDKIATAGLAGSGLTGTLRCDDGTGTLRTCDYGAENDPANPGAIDGDGAENNCDTPADEDGDGVANDGCPDPDPDDGIPAVPAEADQATAISDVEINLNIGRTSGAPASLPIDFDLGIPGFALQIEQGASLNADIPWNLTFGFGISKEHGFYFATHDGPSQPDLPELVVEPYVEISEGATMTGTLAFLQVDVANAGSKLDAKFTVDLQDPGATADGRLTFDELAQGPEFSDVLAFAFQATADINLGIKTGFTGGAGLPQLQADFALDWTWGVGGSSDQTQTPAPANFVSDPDALEPGAGSDLSIGLNNVGINAGSFVSNFLAPVFKDIGRFTDPLMPIVDTVTACIPVLSDLSGDCTNLIDLAGFFGLVEHTETLDTIVGIVKFANALKNFSEAGDVIIPLKGDTLEGSDFQLVGEALRGDTVTSNNVQSAFQDPLSSLDSVLDDLGAKIGDVEGAEFPASGASAQSSGALSGITETLDSIHIKLPFLENPGKMLGILFGQDVDLIVWEPPEFSFGFTYSQKFGPIWPTPPIFIEIGGSASFAINFGIGYDTEGFRNYALNDQGPSALLQGLYLVDRHPLEGGGDINELELRGELFANAQVSVLIFSAGAQGSVYMTIGVDLEDPNSDGKLKYNEAADVIRSTGNVLCIFNLNGEFGVRISVFAEVDLFFWSQRWEKILAEIVLFAFEVKCEPLPDPVLAGPESAGSTTLVLHMGEFRERRGDPSVGYEEINEDFKVTRTATGVTVSAFGLTQVYDGTWTKILARAGDGDDVIALVDGKPTGESKKPIPFDIPADLDGGTEADQLTGSTAGDELVGGDGDDVINARDGTNKVWGDTKDVNVFAGKDVIDAGKDHDEIYGGGGDDRLSAGAGADTIEGNDGKDAIDGGRGVAAMNGQPAVPDGGDTIFGDNSSGGQPTEDTDRTDDTDTIDGGDGDDFIYPSGGADLVNGGNGADTIVDGGDDVDCGAATEEDDVLTGGPDADTISAGNGNDIVIGGSLIAGLPDTGDTKLDGGNDCDVIFGDNAERPGATLVPVDPGVGGADTIEGGNGADEIHGQVGGDLINGDEPGADDSTDGATGNTDGHDVVYGDEPDNTPNGVDRIFGDGGDDDLYGRGGGDHMVGGLGDDEVFGESGEDVMLGDLGSVSAEGVVTLSGGAGNDRLSGGPDDDRMYGQGGRDDVLGDSGADVGYGDGDGEADEDLDRNDLLRGGVGNDLLFGNNGADDLYGEQGNDRLVGGSPNSTSVDDGLGADDGVGFDGATDDSTGDVYGDEILGGSGEDTIAGDNATISGAGAVTLLAEATIGQADLLLGEAADDRIYGENGNDRIIGDDGDDHAEGGDDADEIDGNAGQDDLIGGTTEFADGLAAGEDGDQPDTGDTIRGGGGHDVITGDNAAITKLGAADDLDPVRGVEDVERRRIQLFDVATTAAGEEGADVGFSGEDDLFGGDGYDIVYGQGGDDHLEGNDDDDHLEGNAGNDTMKGQAGQDDVIGGTGRTDTADPLSAKDGRLDEAEVIHGGDGAGGITEDDFDVIMGDNATVLRPDDPATDGIQWDFNTFNSSVRRNVFLYDVATLTNPVDARTNGADKLFGEADADLIYGQGDNDEAEGNEGDDYIEGNDGADTLKGQEDNDDVVGGTGRINTDTETGTDGRLDEGEVLIQGGPGFDHIGGDNAIIVRVLVTGNWVQNTYNDGIQHEPIRLLDIARTGSPANATKDLNTSGGDTIEGNEHDDLIYGQGNDASDPDGTNPVPVRDFLYGNGGDDYMEGNAGNDYMEGNAGQDDMIGGTGLLRGDVAAGVNGRFDGNDEMHGGEDADFQLGDNGSLVRPLDGDGEWTYYVDYNPTTVVRKASRFDVNGPATVSGNDVMNGDTGDDYQWGQDGADVMHGNEDNDDMYGELGDDRMFGDAGQDAMVGDRGGIRDKKLVGNSARVSWDTKGPAFFVYVGLIDGQLDRRVSLTHDIDGTTLGQPGLTVGGSDRMRGGTGHDSMHGAFGDDLMNGDSGGDWLFGADGADVMWGGKGADESSAEDAPTQAEIDAQPGVLVRNLRGAGDRFVDYLFGGHGGQPASNNITQQVLQADILDYLPRAADPSNGFAGDPDAWFEMTDTQKVGIDSNPGDDQYHQGIDWIYGGFDRDVLEGDVGVNGPDFGDRLIDWMGAYNMYTRCNASYGDDGDIRQISPTMQTLLKTMAYGSGAGYTQAEVENPGTSAYRELGLVYPGDKGNNGKAFPTTPGNFNAIDCTPGAG